MIITFCRLLKKSTFMIITILRMYWDYCLIGKMSLSLIFILFCQCSEKNTKKIIHFLWALSSSNKKMSLEFLNLCLRDFLALACSSSMLAIRLISKRPQICIILLGIMNKLITLIYNLTVPPKQLPKAGQFSIAKRWYILAAKISTKN